MIVPKSEINKYRNKHRSRLLGEITDCRAQIGNIEEEPGGSYCVKKDVLKNKKAPW